MPAEKKDAKAGLSEMKEWFGLSVTAITPESAKELGLSRSEGVIVQDVDAGSAGASAGLRKGDVILEVNREKIADEAGEMGTFMLFPEGIHCTHNISYKVNPFTADWLADHS
jgi:predicted metalloprotease with PDZ domain